MKKYKAIIVDDEAKLQEVLRIKLERFCPEVEIIGIASNARDAFELIKEQKPNIVLLDIAMPTESGFDLLHRFHKIDFEIVFVTGFNQYALEALKLSAVDYLLKPVGTKELKTAVQKAVKNIETRNELERYKVLQNNLKTEAEQGDKISILCGDAHEFVKVADIIRCEGWQKYCKIFLKDGTCIVSSYNIGFFKDILQSKGFYSIHKSHLVNQYHIKSYQKTGFVLLSDNSQVPVARRKKEEFKQFIHGMK